MAFSVALLLLLVSCPQPQKTQDRSSQRRVTITVVNLTQKLGKENKTSGLEFMPLNRAS